MIDVKLADELIGNCTIELSTELVNLSDLKGRVLASPIKASREYPPFDRVAMDGIAICYKNSSNNKCFTIQGIQKPGNKALDLKSSKEAIEVMTGAVLPAGTDTVIPYEHIEIKNNQAIVKEEVKLNQNIHFKGSDYLKDCILLDSGLKLNSASIAIIASQGIKEVLVFNYPNIAIISTGDELIEPGLNCKDWQIWRSNPFSISAELESLGLPKENMNMFHLNDNRNQIYNSLTNIIDNFEVIILTGGVSMGKYDFVHSVMADLDVKKIFHKVKQKPGKPIFFGIKNEKIIYGLPGNPVSSLFCTRRYIIPFIERALGLKPTFFKAILSEDVFFKKIDFVLFKAVNIESSDQGNLIATPIKSNGSGDFSSLALSQGFIELPAGQCEYKVGDFFPFYSWKGALS